MNRLAIGVAILLLHTFLATTLISSTHAQQTNEPALTLFSNPIQTTSTPFYLTTTPAPSPTIATVTLSGDISTLPIGSTIDQFTFSITPPSLSSLSTPPTSTPPSQTRERLHLGDGLNATPSIVSFSLVMKLADGSKQHFAAPFQYTTTDSSELTITSDIDRKITVPDEQNWSISIVLQLANVNKFDYKDTMPCRFALTITNPDGLTSSQQTLEATSKLSRAQGYVLNQWYAVAEDVNDLDFRFSIGLNSQQEGLFPTGGYWGSDLDVDVVFDEFENDDKGDLVKNFGTVQLSLEVFTTHPTTDPEKPFWGFSYLPYDDLEVQFYPNNLQFTNCLLGSIPVVMDTDALQQPQKPTRLTSRPISLTRQVYDAVQYSQLTCNDIYLSPPKFTPSSQLSEPPASVYSEVYVHYEMEFNDINTGVKTTRANLTSVEFFYGFFPQLVYPNKARRDVAVRYPSPLGSHIQSRTEVSTNSQDDSRWTTWANLYMYDIVYSSMSLDNDEDRRQFESHKWFSPVFFTKRGLYPDGRDYYPLYGQFPQDLTANILKYIPLCPIQGDYVRTLPSTIVNTTINSYQHFSTFNGMKIPLGFTSPFQHFFRNEPYLFTPYYRLSFTDHRWLDRYFPYQQDPTTQLYLQATLWHRRTKEETTQIFAFQSGTNMGNSKYYSAKTNLPTVHGYKKQQQQEPANLNSQLNNNSNAHARTPITPIQTQTQSNAESGLELFFTTHMYADPSDQTQPSYSILRISAMFGSTHFAGSFQTCTSSTHATTQFQIEYIQDYISDAEPSYPTIFVKFNQPTSGDFSLSCPDANLVPPDLGSDMYYLDLITIASNIFAVSLTDPAPPAYAQIIVGNEIVQVTGNAIRWTRDGMGFPTSRYGKMKPGTQSYVLTHRSMGIFNAVLAGITIPLWLILIFFMVRTYLQFRSQLKPNFVIQIHDHYCKDTENQLPTFIDLHQYPQSQHRAIVHAVLESNKNAQSKKHQQQADLIQIKDDDQDDIGMLFLSSPLLSRFR